MTLTLACLSGIVGPMTAEAIAAHPRDRSMESWRGRKAVLASRGETDGPRVDECTASLEWHRNRATMMKVGLTEAEAEDLADLIDQRAEADAETDAQAAVTP